MRRPVVEQCENRTGGYWFRVRSGQNGLNVLTSEMYSTRSNAKRAARAYIRSIAPAPVRYRYNTGPYGDIVVKTEVIR